MRARTKLLIVGLLFLNCGALTPPRPDGGSGGGSDSGSVGGGGGSTNTAPWVEVALQIPPGTLGSVQRLAARPGELYALVANQYVLRSVGAATAAS